MSDAAAAPGFPRLTYLRIKNYRALRDVELRDLTPLTVFIGPNGSGKSTVLDALDFLTEAVSGDLHQAWEKRNRFAGMRTRGQEGAIEFELECSLYPLADETVVRYSFAIDEKDGQLTLVDEVLTTVVKGLEKHVFSSKELKGEKYFSIRMEPSESPSLYEAPFNYGFEKTGSLAIQWASGLELLDGQAIFDVTESLQSYRYIHLTDDHLKGYSDAGPREKLSANGDNLPNVLYYLHTKHPEALARVTEKLRRWVPQLAEVVPEITSDERLLLRFKDAAFDKPLPAQYMSDGTMRLAALLTLLYEPDATGLLGLEEPENELHPRLLPRLAEELVKATETRQLLVATHSPALLDGLEPEQVWVLARGADGYTQATRVADMPDIVAMVEEGSPLGYLWSSNFFTVGDPLAPQSSSSAPQ